ncbi:leucine-rich repeat domain-containing protein [Sutcliffiella horikoshii]|uniref:leucine-rich repeat domain-containing protein n=1 Tax=Sutcliffiella horikoshii TaxID=79883 RepID=UPI00203DFCCA|nr:leucine-rich repeat domain-containing protein [Sutcliffiella horikoshii]MCM3620167.1 leucine-rich repeat domain-containing protein [Sutcliffiella horikoshii]
MKRSFWLNVTVVFTLLLSLLSPAAQAFSEGTGEEFAKVLLTKAVSLEEGNVLVWETHGEDLMSSAEVQSFYVVKNNEEVEVTPEEVAVLATENKKVYTYTDKVEDPTAIMYSVVWKKGEEIHQSNEITAEAPAASVEEEAPSNEENADPSVQTQEETVQEKESEGSTVVTDEEQTEESSSEPVVTEEEQTNESSSEPAATEDTDEVVENALASVEEVEGAEVNFIPSEKENYLKNALIDGDEEAFMFLDKMYVNEHSFGIMWFGFVDKSLGRISTYELYLNDTLITTGGPRLSDYEFTNLTPDTVYEVRVKALNKTNDVLVEESLKIKTLPAPSGKVIKFEDANLKKAIQSQMNLNREIQESDMEHLTMLDAGALGIKSLKGLENAVNLEVLFLYSNSIKDITPLAGLTKLFLLDLEENNITSITALSNLKELYILGLAYNPVSNIQPLAGLTSLEGLFLHNTEITDISILENLLNLTFVTIADTKIDFSPESAVWDLLNIWAEAGVYVDVLEEEYFEPLELYLYGVTEQSISASWWYYPENEEDYEKEYTYKVYVNDKFYKKTKMTDLTITGLNPEKDYVIKVKMFDSNGEMLHETFEMAQTLSKPSGPIISIPDKGLKAAIRGELGLEAINRDIQQSDMDRLGYLFAGWMDIKKLDGLEHAVNLYDLDVTGNQIKDLTPLKGLKSLESLNLSDNLITNIKPLNDLYILSLDLSDNPITDISGLNGLLDLEYVYLHNTNITDISVLLELDYLWEVTLFGIAGLTFEEGSPELDVVEKLRALGVMVYLSEEDYYGPSPLTIDVVDVTDNSIEIEWYYEWDEDVDYYVVLLNEEVIDITEGNSYIYEDLDADTTYELAIAPAVVDEDEEYWTDYMSITATTLPPTEKPVEEEKPVDEEEPKDEDKAPVVVKPVDKDKNKTDKKPTPVTDTKKGNKLPLTATNTLNYILIGLALLLVGTAGFLWTRRRVVA